MTEQNCFGFRMKAYDKCETCDDVTKCSNLTLRLQFENKVHVID